MSTARSFQSCEVRTGGAYSPTMYRLIYAAAVFAGLCFLSAAASAQTGPGLLLKPLMSEDENVESRGNALFLGSAHAEDGANFDMSAFELEGRYREWRERLIPRIGWDISYYNLRSDIPILDQDVLDASVAVGMELGVYSNWRSALTVGIGYAGNAPFGEGDAYYGKATLVLGKKLDKQTDFALVIDYDGNRSWYPDVPLPGFAYRHEFDPTLSYVVGVPISSVTWRPNRPVMLEVTWTFVDRIEARLEYELSPIWIVFMNLEQRFEAFSVDNIGDNDRLLLEQRRAELGIRWHPWEHTSLLLAGGYTFKTEFSVGFDQRDSQLVADISDEPYVRVGFERRW
ncbi:MAG: hypothetical protein QOF78_1263 [Phycisphaerales bacterium]|nr:hypothetical protein [Phycisphaerales bacterium]